MREWGKRSSKNGRNQREIQNHRKKKAHDLHWFPSGIPCFIFPQGNKTTSSMGRPSSKSPWEQAVPGATLGSPAMVPRKSPDHRIGLSELVHTKWAGPSLVYKLIESQFSCRYIYIWYIQHKFSSSIIRSAFRSYKGLEALNEVQDRWPDLGRLVAVFGRPWLDFPAWLIHGWECPFTQIIKGVLLCCTTHVGLCYDSYDHPQFKIKGCKG